VSVRTIIIIVIFSVSCEILKKYDGTYFNANTLFFLIRFSFLIFIFFFSITLNKNAVHGDVSAFVPGGVRIGTPALTSRSFKENDFVKVADFLHRAVQIALRIQVLFFFLLCLKQNTK